jgi:WD40-like Beta Propeller Repeat
VTSIEDRLRDAYRDAAETVRPDGIRQMHEPSVVISLPGDREVRRGARRFVVPLAAAAAVAVVGVLAAVVVPGALSASRSAHGGYQPPTAQGAGPSDRFIVSSNGAGTDLIIRNARSGARVATMPTPARGLTFSGLATGDGRHYVAELSRPGVCRTWLYQFRLSGAGRPGGLTPFALPTIRELLGPIALSQDNTTFAYYGDNCSNPARTSPADLTALSIPTMKASHWTIPKQADVSSVSLTADGSMLAYNIGATKLFASAAYVLPTSAAPGSAIGQSKVVVRGSQFGRGEAIDADVISPDGSTLYFTTNGTGSAFDNRWQLRAESLPAGTTRVIARYTGLPEWIIANWSVTRAIVPVQLPVPSTPQPSPSRAPASAPSRPTPSPSDARRASGATPSPSPGLATLAGKRSRSGRGPSSGLRVVMINLRTGKLVVLNPRIWYPSYPTFTW